MIAGFRGGLMGISSNLDIFLEEDYTAGLLANDTRASPPVVRKIRELILVGRPGN